MGMKNKLLVVDDDTDTCDNLCDILSEFGFEVDVAYRGAAALDRCTEYPYRLALLDFKLPCMSGVELFQRMRKIRNNIQGLLVTAFASPETTKEALAAGLQHVVSKPVEIPKLVLLIEQALV